MASEHEFLKYRLEIYWDIYWKEFELKNEITSSISFLVGALTLVFGGLAYLADAYTFETTYLIDFSLLETVFGFTIVLTAGFGIFSAIYAVRALVGHTYDYVPKPTLLAKYLSDLEDFIESEDSVRRLEEIENKFSITIEKYLISCSSNNRDMNIARSAFRFRAYRHCALAFLGLLGSFFCYLTSILPFRLGIA